LFLILCFFFFFRWVTLNSFIFGVLSVEEWAQTYVLERCIIMERNKMVSLFSSLFSMVHDNDEINLKANGSVGIFRRIIMRTSTDMIISNYSVIANGFSVINTGRLSSRLLCLICSDEKCSPAAAPLDGAEFATFCDWSMRSAPGIPFQIEKCPGTRHRLQTTKLESFSERSSVAILLFQACRGEVEKWRSLDPAFAFSVILDIPRCDDVGKPLKKTHTRSGGTGVRTRDLPNVKWRAKRLATVLGV
jgi:hypothetical protein